MNNVNWKVVVIVTAIAVLVIDAILNPSRRFVATLFTLIGLSYLTKSYFAKNQHRS